MSRALCSLVLFLSLVTCAVLPGTAQFNCSADFVTQSAQVKTFNPLLVQPAAQCNSTSYATGAQGYVLETVSTGLFSWSLYNSTIRSGASIDGPITDGSASTCAWFLFQGRVGATYQFQFTCAANDTNRPGECNVNYNFTLACQQAPPSLLPKSSSSSSSSSSTAGYNAARVQFAGAGWTALLLFLAVATAMAA